MLALARFILASAHRLDLEQCGVASTTVERRNAGRWALFLADRRAQLAYSGSPLSAGSVFNQDREAFLQRKRQPTPMRTSFPPSLCPVCWLGTHQENCGKEYQVLGGRCRERRRRKGWGRGGPLAMQSQLRRCMRGRSVLFWKWKNRIDRCFLKQFDVLPHALAK